MGDGQDRRFRSGLREYRCQSVPIRSRCVPEPSQPLRTGRQLQSFQSFNAQNPVNGDTPRGAVGTEVKGGIVAGWRAFLTAKSRRGGGATDENWRWNWRWNWRRDGRPAGDGLDRRFRSGLREYRCQSVPIKMRCLPEPSQPLRSGGSLQSFQSFHDRNPRERGHSPWGCRNRGEGWHSGWLEGLFNG